MALGPRALCTVDEVLAMLKLTDAPPDPADVEPAIDGASEAIQRFCKRQFALGEPGEERIYAGAYWSGAENGYVLQLDDVVTIDSVESVLDATPITDWFALPLSPGLGEPTTGMVLATQPLAPVVVTGQFGWPEVPESVHYAAILQSAEWYTQDSSRISESWRAEANVPAPRGLLYAVQNIVRPFRRVTLA